MTEIRKAWREPHAQGGSQAVFWNMRTTPIFPAGESHSKPSREYVMYVYAGGLDPRLTEAERTSGLLKEWRWNASTGESSLASLSSDVEAIGTQTFKPVKSASAWPRMKDVKTAALDSVFDAHLTPTNERRLIRDAYCEWIAENDVIAELVRSRQPAFFTALDCAKSTASAVMSK